MALDYRAANRQGNSGVKLENPLGMIRGRSVEALPMGVPELRQREHAASGLLPVDCIELAKGTQENEPQYPDARTSPVCWRKSGAA